MSLESKGVSHGSKSVRDLLAKISAKEIEVRQREFLAPYCEGIKTAVVKIDGANYKFRIVGFKGSGFGIFRPTDPTCARFIKEADPIVSCDYLQTLPKIHLILVCETDIGWCCYPFNVESSKTKLGLEHEVIVRGVSDAERFDVITARFDGFCFWYEESFVGDDPVKSEYLRSCFANRGNSVEMDASLQKLKGLTPEQKQAFRLSISSWKVFQKSTTEDRIKEMLFQGGAELESYVVRGDNIELMWKSRGGGFYSSIVQKDSFHVECSGICLDGEDGKFHLADLPGVVREGEEKGLIYRTRDTRYLDVED